IPGMVNSPFFLVSLTAVSASMSRKPAVCLLVSSSFSAIWRTSAVFVNPFAMYVAPSYVLILLKQVACRYQLADCALCVVGIRESPVLMRVRRNRTAIHLRPFQAFCQLDLFGFHRFFRVFPGFCGSFR